MRALIFLLLVACGIPTSPPVIGPPTETECPPGGTTLSYENFAAKFMTDYCNQCHHSALMGEARKGAPTFHDFDTYFGIKGVAHHVDETTAAGPAVINRGMPPAGYPLPSDEERFLLGEWIACELPREAD